MNKEQLEKIIEEYYKKWSSSVGLNEYEKIALKKYEARYKILNNNHEID